MPMVIGPTLDTTYMVQIQHRDGSWAFNDQGEWDSYDEADDIGKAMFGPDCPHRVIKVTREIVDSRMSCPRDCGTDVRDHRSTDLIEGGCDVPSNPHVDHERHGLCAIDGHEIHRYPSGWRHVNPMSEHLVRPVPSSVACSCKWDKRKARRGEYPHR